MKPGRGRNLNEATAFIAFPDDLSAQQAKDKLTGCQDPWVTPSMLEVANQNNMDTFLNVFIFRLLQFVQPYCL